jgi:CubicO group peptidase (beta-lactamase class C family)
MGNLAFEGAGSRTPMAGDTICRIASMTKPIVAACAMTLVEDCTLASTTRSTRSSRNWRT